MPRIRRAARWPRRGCCRGGRPAGRGPRGGGRRAHSPPGRARVGAGDAGRGVADVGQVQRRLAEPGVVAPEAGARVEAVVGQQPVAVGGEQVDGVDEVVGDGVGDEVVEVDPGPAGLDALAAVADLVAAGVRARRVDGQQPVPVRAGAGAAAAGLDAEQVVEQRDDEVVVQVAVRRAGCGRRRWTAGAPAGCRGPRCPGWPAQRSQRVLPQLLFPRLDQVGADGLLEGEDQPGPDGLDDGRGAALLAGDRVVEVAVPERVDERDRAAARRGRDRVADQLAADDQDAGGLRAADELVRRQEHRVLVVTGARGAVAHPDRHVRPGGGVVPERQRAVRVQQRGDRGRCRTGCR